MAASVKDKKKLKNNIETINSYMCKLADELNGLSQNLNNLMKGDNDGPYWNGEDAASFYKIAVKNLNNNIEDYVSARGRLESLGTLYELVDQGIKK